MITKDARKHKLINKDEYRLPTQIKVPYKEVIESLLYLANVSRPAMIYMQVHYLDRMQLDLTVEDWEDVETLFCYAKKTIDLGLTFRAKDRDMEAFTDASFRDNSGSISTCGYVVKLFGQPVSWRSHKQAFPHPSTCGAEYVTMSETCSEIISQGKALRDMMEVTMYPAIIWCDNKAAVNNTQMEGCNKLKYLDDSIDVIKAYLEFRKREGRKRDMSETHGDFIKSCASQGRVEIRWISTNDKPADIFIKALAFDKHEKFRAILLNL